MYITQFIKLAMEHDYYKQRENLRKRVERGISLYSDEIESLERDVRSFQRDLKTLKDIQRTVENTPSKELLDKLTILVNEMSNSRMIYDQPYLGF